MDKKQVIIVTLLVVAIILSAASVMMNVSVLGGLSIQESPATPSSGEVGIEIIPNDSNGGTPNGLG